MVGETTFMMVFADPVSPDQEHAFNEWYTQVHVPDLLTVGVTASTRYRVGEPPFPGQGLGHGDLAVHEIPSDRADEVMEAIRVAQVEGRMGLSPALDAGTAEVRFVTAITERMTADRAQAMGADPRYAELKAGEEPYVMPAAGPVSSGSAASLDHSPSEPS